MRQAETQNVAFLVRDLEDLQEGLKALERSIHLGQSDNAKFILGNLVSDTAALIATCKPQHKRPLTVPDHRATRTLL